MHNRTCAVLAAGVVCALSGSALAQTDASVQLQGQSQVQVQVQPTPTVQTPPPPPPPPPEVTIHTVVTPKQDAKTPLFDLVSLRIMREKGIITEREYKSALEEIGASVGDERANEGLSLVVGKWSATLYGFAEADFIVDSTQSFSEVSGNSLVQRPIGSPEPQGPPVSQYPGSNARVQFAVRNSRFGFRFRAPEVHGVRASATLEMDFLGFDTPATEAGLWNNPTLRVRHAYLKVETPIVDFLVGQYWHLFGWQPYYFPNTVEIQGLPGQLYERTAQLRLSHRFPIGDTSLEIAVAALRPPTKDGGVPDLAGGMRFTFEKWRGVQTTGATSTTIAPASIAITGDYRDFRLPSFLSLPTQTVALTTAAVAVDAFIPIIPARHHHRGNTLSISGELVYGGGISDMYTGLTGGITMPSFVNTSGIANAPSYVQTVDNGMVIFDNNGGLGCPPGNPQQPCNNLHAIIWTTGVAGLQYYLPGVNGRIWVAGNYAHTESPNIQDFTSNVAPNNLSSTYTQQTNVRKSEDWFDANVFFEPMSSLRIGLEYAAFIDHYVDGIQATNHRAQLSGFFLF